MAKGLGTGLGALLGSEASEAAGGVAYLPVVKIEPRADQPRVKFDETALLELADSIREHGLIQPIAVRDAGGGYYQIIAGERRWRAARLAGLSEVPVRILEADDRETAELALVENLQREDLDPVEEAKGYRALMENYSLTQEAVAERVGKSRPVIANALRLLALPEDVLEKLSEGSINLSAARALLELPGAGLQSSAAAEIVERQLTVREATALIKRMISGGTEKAEKKRPVGPDGVDYMAEVEKDLTRSLGRKVRIVEGRRRGKFEIEYYGKEDFELVREALMKLRSGGEKS